MTPSRLVGIIGAFLGGGLVAAGLVLGFLPVTTSADGACGSPFHAVSLAASPLACHDLLSGRTPLAWGLLIAGLVVLAVSLLAAVQPAGSSAHGTAER